MYKYRIIDAATQTDIATVTADTRSAAYRYILAADPADFALNADAPAGIKAAARARADRKRRLAEIDTAADMRAAHAAADKAGKAAASKADPADAGRAYRVAYHAEYAAQRKQAQRKPSKAAPMVDAVNVDGVTVRAYGSLDNESIWQSAGDIAYSAAKSLVRHRGSKLDFALRKALSVDAGRVQDQDALDMIAEAAAGLVTALRSAEGCVYNRYDGMNVYDGTCGRWVPMHIPGADLTAADRADIDAVTQHTVNAYMRGEKSSMSVSLDMIKSYAYKDKRAVNAAAQDAAALDARAYAMYAQTDAAASRADTASAAPVIQRILDGLTERRIEILRYLGRGFNIRQIADALGISSPGTLSRHIDAIRRTAQRIAPTYVESVAARAAADSLYMDALGAEMTARIAAAHKWQDAAALSVDGYKRMDLTSNESKDILLSRVDKARAAAFNAVMSASGLTSRMAAAMEAAYDADDIAAHAAQRTRAAAAERVKAYRAADRAERDAAARIAAADYARAAADPAADPADIDRARRRAAAAEANTDAGRARADADADMLIKRVSADRRRAAAADRAERDAADPAVKYARRRLAQQDVYTRANRLDTAADLVRIYDYMRGIDGTQTAASMYILPDKHAAAASKPTFGHVDQRRIVVESVRSILDI